MRAAGTVVALGRLGIVLAALAVWHALHVVFGPLSFPAIDVVARQLISACESGQLGRDLLATLAEAGLGLVVGTALGIASALLLYRYPAADAALAPFLASLMAIPKMALAPFLMLWLGIGFTCKVAFVASAVFFIVLIATSSGLRSVDPLVLASARVVGARGFVLARYVLLPSTAPFVFGSLKIAVPHAITIAVVGEFMASDEGLGHFVKHAAAQADVAGVFAGVGVITAMVLVLGTMLERAERAVFRWRADPPR